MVLKCRHKVTGQIVAIKKFKESDDDEQVKKTALREIRVLKQLRHENIVTLLEVFRVKGKLYLVFEFVEKTILEEIEKNPEGLEPRAIKRLMWQLVRAIHFCHSHNIIHRDIKPENLLVSRNGVLKLCDFGFARPMAAPGAKYTEYVSTRWYRAPELLVGDVSYGKAVDVWSIGCMFAEITTGLPLFPGDSDIDQLYHILKCLGHITSRQQELFRKNALYVGVKLPQAAQLESLEARFPQLDKLSLDFLRQTIQDEPLDRWTCDELLKHPFFENAGDKFESELQEAIARDLNDMGAVKKKRIRKPPRANGNTNSTTAQTQALPSPTLSIKAGYEEPTMAAVSEMAAFKPSFKPIVAQSMPKDKQQYTHKNMAPPMMGMSKTGLPSSNTTTGYHLPTLHGSGPGNASSSSLASNDVLLLSSSNSSSPVNTNANGSKKAAPPPSIAENQASVAGLPVPADHLVFVNQHGSMRQSMTSHGARNGGGASMMSSSMGSTGLSFSNGFAAAPKPPPTSYMKNPYMAPPNTSNKRTTTRGGGGGVGPSGRHGMGLQSSMEIYSPAKKLGGGSRKANANTTPNGITGGLLAMDLTPQGIYVPPRTSHSTMRGGMGNEQHSRARRENDLRTF